MSQSSTGDYTEDAGPAVNALITGHPGRFMDHQPLMGSFAVLARAPFALIAHLAGGSERAVYEAGALACIVAACLLAVTLLRLTGQSPNRVLLVPVLAVINPATRAAVDNGHPEEILAAVLCISAVLLAGRRSLWAAAALGLALATKQWAVLAVVPVLLATPARRRVVVAIESISVAALLTLPLLAGSLSSFARTSTQAATSPTTVGRATVWFLFAHPHRLRLHLGPGFPTSVTSYSIPAWLAHATHPAIVLLLPLVALVAWRRGGDPLALLALVLLGRCVLDPVDNEYYHVPFLLSLLAFEVVSRRLRNGIPVLTLFSAVSLWITFDFLDRHAAAPQLTASVYLAWTAVVGLLLLAPAGLLPAGVVRRAYSPTSA